MFYQATIMNEVFESQQENIPTPHAELVSLQENLEKKEADLLGVLQILNKRNQSWYLQRQIDSWDLDWLAQINGFLHEKGYWLMIYEVRAEYVKTSKYGHFKLWPLWGFASEDLNQTIQEYFVEDDIDVPTLELMWMGDAKDMFMKYWIDKTYLAVDKTYLIRSMSNYRDQLQHASLVEQTFLDTTISRLVDAQILEKSILSTSLSPEEKLKIMIEKQIHYVLPPWFLQEFITVLDWFVYEWGGEVTLTEALEEYVFWLQGDNFRKEYAHLFHAMVCFSGDIFDEKFSSWGLLDASKRSALLQEAYMLYMKEQQWHQHHVIWKWY